MCGRMSLFAPRSAIEERFDATFAFEYAPRYNLAPGDDLAAVRNDAPDEIEALEWGLLPGWVDDPGDFPRPINARSETAAEKPAFREALERRRCLVLADGFYEWAGDRGRRRPYRVTRDDGDPLAMAGLWERRGGRETVAVLTTEANGVVAPIHDRMPVILEPDQEGAWLETDAPGELLDPHPGDALRAYRVSTAVNDPSNDSPGVIEPAAQTGLDEF